MEMTSLAVDNFQDQPMLRVVSDMVPIVTASGFAFRSAVFLFFLDERPFFVQLNLLGVWGKKRAAPRGPCRRVCRRPAPIGLQRLCRRRLNAKFGGCRSDLSDV